LAFEIATMATTNTMTDTSSGFARPDGGLLVLLPAAPRPELEAVLANLAQSLPAENLLVATSEELSPESYSPIRLVASPEVRTSWILTAAEFANAYQLAQRNNARAILLLGGEADSLSSSGLRDLANAVINSPADLAVPRYDLQPRAGLVNSAIIYPINRALFASRVRFPQAIDLGLSLRMAERLANAANRFNGMNQTEVLLWPVNEAAIAGLTVEEIDVGTRDVPQPADPDLNAVLPFVTGSLFSDIEAKASFWQRARVTPPPRRTISTAPGTPTDFAAEVASMVNGFRLAYNNLQEIWGLVLPPNSMLGLKRLSLTDAANFRMPEQLWARILYDFLIAYRLRTMNRGHLLGALIPLYLAWVASHINVIASGSDPERHIEALAAAFEADKPYLVARWRWPDRFNP
jgi:glucosylglycerate synthase